MTITNGYTDLATFQNMYYENQGTDPDPDMEFRAEQVIEACSRVIDRLTNRRFYVTSETRYYTANDPKRIFVHDYTGVTALTTDEDDDATYEITWATTDYHNMPFNAALDGEPYTYIEVTQNGNYTFPKNLKGVSLQATFGYGATTPEQIREACLLASGQLWKRKDAVFGVAGTNALGLFQVIESEFKRDAHLMTLLYPFIKQVGGPE